MPLEDIQFRLRQRQAALAEARAAREAEWHEEGIQNRLRQRGAALAEAGTAREADWPGEGKGGLRGSGGRGAGSSTAGAGGTGEEEPLEAKKVRAPPSRH